MCLKEDTFPLVPTLIYQYANVFTSCSQTCARLWNTREGSGQEIK